MLSRVLSRWGDVLAPALGEVVEGVGLPCPGGPVQPELDRTRMVSPVLWLLQVR